MSDKRPTKFEEGYICAVSNLIAMHGCNTDAWDTFKQLARPLDTVLAWPGLSEFDIENLKELRSFGE